MTLPPLSPWSLVTVPMSPQLLTCVCPWVPCRQVQGLIHLCLQCPQKVLTNPVQSCLCKWTDLITCTPWRSWPSTGNPIYSPAPHLPHELPSLILYGLLLEPTVSPLLAGDAAKKQESKSLAEYLTVLTLTDGPWLTMVPLNGVSPLWWCESIPTHCHSVFYLQ